MSIGLDTTVVLRLLTGEPPKQFKQAQQFLQQLEQRGEQVLVNDLVIAEAYYALHYHYQMPKKEARQLLHRFLTSGLIRPDPVDLPLILAQAHSAGIVNRIIASRYRGRAAQTATFDKNLAKLEAVHLLSS